MPLSEEQYQRLLDRGVSPDQLERYESGALEVSGPAARRGAAGSRLGPASKQAPVLFDLIPAAGGLLGGTLGGIGGTAFGLGFGGIPGAMGGAALGTAGGESARQHLARLMGFDVPETSLEAAGEIGGQGAVGGLLAAPPAAIAKGGMALAKKPIGSALAKLFRRRIPGVGAAEDLADFAKTVTATSAGTKPVLAGASRIKAMRPLRANASRQARIDHALELEEAMKEAGFDAAAKRSLRTELGHAPVRSQVVGEIKPGAAVSRIKRAELGKVAGEIKPGAAALRIKRAGEIKPASTAKPRHEVEYFSKPEGKHIDIEGMGPDELKVAISELSSRNPKPGSVGLRQLEAVRKELAYKTEPITTYFSSSRGEMPIKTMNQAHIEQAYRKVAETNPKPGSYEHRLLDELLKEAKHRLTTTGIQIGQASARFAR